jgi:DNA-binding NarL/FixJ family response regulator
MSTAAEALTDTGDVLGVAIFRFSEEAGLSSREHQILYLAARGLSDKEISRELRLAYTTIKSYWLRICSKVSVRNRQLVIGEFLAFLAAAPDCRSLAAADANRKGGRVSFAARSETTIGVSVVATKHS